MNWKLKHAVRQAVLRLPGGDALYRRLTSEILGTQAGMAAKWFRVFPTHIKVLQEQFGDEARAQRMWCVDCGATVAAGLAMAIATEEPGVLTERRKPLSSRYNGTCRKVLQEKGAELARLSNASKERMELVQRAAECIHAHDVFGLLKQEYSEEHAFVEDDEWRGTISFIFSAGTLEHYTPDELEVEVARMARALKSGGVLSHVVDHRDHRWHADKTLCPLAHLTMEDDEYSTHFGNTLDYHNRWLRSRWVELFERHGFDVSCRTVNAFTDDLPPLDKSTLATPFQSASEDDFRTLVTHFVAVKT